MNLHSASACCFVSLWAPVGTCLAYTQTNVYIRVCIGEQMCVQAFAVSQSWAKLRTVNISETIHKIADQTGRSLGGNTPTERRELHMRRATGAEEETERIETHPTLTHTPIDVLCYPSTRIHTQTQTHTLSLSVGTCMHA